MNLFSQECYQNNVAVIAVGITTTLAAAAAYFTYCASSMIVPGNIAKTI